MVQKLDVLPPKNNKELGETPEPGEQKKSLTNHSVPTIPFLLFLQPFLSCSVHHDPNRYGIKHPMAIRFLNKERPRQLTDEELVQRFADTANQACFEELYRRYKHLSFGVCLKMMKNEDDSRDIVSEVFRILYQKLPAAQVKSFKSYLYAVSRNECIARLRQRKSEANKLADWRYTEKPEMDFVENDNMASLIDGEPSMETTVENAVQLLGEEQRTCIHLFFYENKSYKDIAEKTGYTEKQVKSYLQNGKRNLRIMLEKEMKKHIA